MLQRQAGSRVAKLRERAVVAKLRILGSGGEEGKEGLFGELKAAGVQMR
jgi:hypothetical protein